MERVRAGRGCRGQVSETQTYPNYSKYRLTSQLKRQIGRTGKTKADTEDPNSHMPIPAEGDRQADTEKKDLDRHLDTLESRCAGRETSAHGEESIQGKETAAVNLYSANVMLQSKIVPIHRNKQAGSQL